METISKERLLVLCLITQDDRHTLELTISFVIEYDNFNLIFWGLINLYPHRNEKSLLIIKTRIKRKR